jgi:hypothetical protein
MVFKNVGKATLAANRINEAVAALPAVTDSQPILQAVVLQPTQSPSLLPPAAWYGDPERPGQQRWWDGTAWGVRDTEFRPS